MGEVTKERLDNLGKYNTDETILDLLTHIESLQSRIAELERTNKKHCKAHLMSIDKIDKLQTKGE